MVSPPPPAESNFIEIIHYPTYSNKEQGKRNNYPHSMHPTPYGKGRGDERYQMSHSYSGYIPSNPAIVPMKQDRSNSVITSTEYSRNLPITKTTTINKDSKVNILMDAAEILEMRKKGQSGDLMTMHENKSPRTIHAGKQIPITLLSTNKKSLAEEAKITITNSSNMYPIPVDDGKETDILDSESDDGDIPLYSHDRKIEESSDDSEEEELSPEYKELMEREEIRTKYIGDAEGKAEDWENPDFNLYKMTDRYGFVHKDTDKIETEDTIHEKQLELKREYKWLKMLKTKGKNHKKWEERIWKGIPDKIRPSVWPILLECQVLKDQYPKNYYKELLERSLLVCKDIKQIDLDINRTYRDHLAFRKRYDLKQKSLFNLLTACAMFNTEVGYCQGMSQIGALFLMYMDEEDSFWCMHSLLTNKKWGMHGFFKIGFPSLMRFQNHFNNIIAKYLPKLHKHLQVQDIPSIYLTKWWFGCFLDRVPFPLALRFWDVFLLNGNCMLIVIGYTILHLHQKKLRKCSIEAYLHYIQDTLASDFGYTMYDTMLNLEKNYKKLKSHNDHLPPPPSDTDPVETPQQSFGIIMNRSLDEIKSEVDEIRSLRKSRCNSISGRSPAVNKKKFSPQLRETNNDFGKNHSKISKPMNSIPFNNMPEKVTATYSPTLVSRFPRENNDSKGAINNTPPSYHISNTSYKGHNNPSDPFYHSLPDPKIQLTKYGRTHPESPLVGRRTPAIQTTPTLSSNGHNRRSFYDNVEELTNETRVIKLPNNVTCIEMGDNISLSRPSSKASFTQGNKNIPYTANITNTRPVYASTSNISYQQQTYHPPKIHYPKPPLKDYRTVNVGYHQNRGNGSMYPQEGNIKNANRMDRQSFI
uniref:Rab-GAP TBC domain-containing protein n=1 Tax=Parastrongyloides trichosuri TaxID=131310 RepID=A0A0N4ZAX7_PARTI